MLDSLVRVSRRVGRGAGTVATDPMAPMREAQRHQPAVERHCEQSRPVEPARGLRAPHGAGESLSPGTGPPPEPVNTTPVRGWPPCSGASRPPPEPVVALRDRGKCTPRATERGTRRSPTRGDPAKTPASVPLGLNSTGGRCGPVRLPLNGFTYS